MTFTLLQLVVDHLDSFYSFSVSEFSHPEKKDRALFSVSYLAREFVEISLFWLNVRFEFGQADEV